MKNIFSAVVLLFAVAAIFLTGCQSRPHAEIENHNWLFSHAQKESDGSIAACSEYKSPYWPSAEVIDLQCDASNGILKITGSTNKNCELRYTVETKRPNDVIYNITSGEKSGLASVGITEYYDGGSEYTLIISFDNYVLQFFETIE